MIIVTKIMVFLLVFACLNVISNIADFIAAFINSERLQKHNRQYPPINIHKHSTSHDRFLIIDNTEVYHIGASLKDLGKKLFAFSKLNISPKAIL
mgnify:CR=1 FL=1